MKSHVGFAFTEGRCAVFHIPARHRFVIEQLKLSRLAEHGCVLVHLEMKAPRHNWKVTLYCPPADASPDFSGALPTGVPIVLTGSSRNTLLFNNREGENSPLVPAWTYLQVWGYLEADEFASGSWGVARRLAA